MLLDVKEKQLEMVPFYELAYDIQHEGKVTDNIIKGYEPKDNDAFEKTTVRDWVHIFQDPESVKELFRKVPPAKKEKDKDKDEITAPVTKAK